MTAQDADILTALMKGDLSGVTDQWLRKMKEQYPFFPVPEAINLRDNNNSMSAHERNKAISHIALALGGGGIQAAGMICGNEDITYPEEKKISKPSTENTIEKFLNTYGNIEDTEISTLEKLIFNPVADYSQQLAREAKDLPENPSLTGNSQEDRINRFILSVNGHNHISTEVENVPIEIPETEQKTTTSKAPKTPKKNVSEPLAKAPEQPADNSLLSESLAKIYIKTKRYERAYEILNRLSLAFPEKNAYFADQLRFLRKLMLVESYSKKRIENKTDQEK